MAPLSKTFRKKPSSSRANNVICFYCNVRDQSRVQDGSLRQWECEACQSMNYYDENGEITHPPAESVSASEPTRFAQAIPRPASPLSIFPPSDNAFCETCLKNQHLYTSSLAQYYVPDYDPNDPRSEALQDEKFEQFKADLEERYPQVCEKCEPGVLQRIKQGRYLAQTDNLRRRLKMMRAKNERHEPMKVTDIFLALGRILWWVGLCMQVTWDVLEMLESGSLKFLSSCENDLDLLDDTEPSPICLTFAPLVSYTQSCHQIQLTVLANWSLTMTLLACGIILVLQRTSKRRAVDSMSWYMFQVLWLGGRGLLWASMLPVWIIPTAGKAHSVMLGFSILIALAAPPSTKTDVGRLFKSIQFGTVPERLVSQSRRPQPERMEVTEPLSGSDMTRALQDLEDDHNPRSPRQSTNNYRTAPNSQQPQSPTEKYQHNPLDGSLDRTKLTHPISLRQLPQRSSTPLISTFASRMSEDEWLLYMASGDIPAHMQEPTAPEPMDWEPIQTQFHAESRRELSVAYIPPPDTTKPAFWFKVPAAPITPAHKIRNPPNPPRFIPASETRKENFFANSPQPQPFVAQKAGQPFPAETPIIHQQKLFFPQHDQHVNGLAESFNMFDLDRTSEKPQNQSSDETQSMKEADSQLQSRPTWKSLAMAAVVVLISIISYSYLG